MNKYLDSKIKNITRKLFSFWEKWIIIVKKEGNSVVPSIIPFLGLGGG